MAIRTACELSRRGKRVFFFAGVAPVDACLEATGVKVFCLNQSGEEFYGEIIK